MEIYQVCISFLLGMWYVILLVNWAQSWPREMLHVWPKGSSQVLDVDWNRQGQWSKRVEVIMAEVCARLYCGPNKDTTLARFPQTSARSWHFLLSWWRVFCNWLTSYYNIQKKKNKKTLHFGSKYRFVKYWLVNFSDTAHSRGGSGQTRGLLTFWMIPWRAHEDQFFGIWD